MKEIDDNPNKDQLKYYIIENIIERRIVAIYPFESLSIMYPDYQVLYGPFDNPELAVNKAIGRNL